MAGKAKFDQEAAFKAIIGAGAEEAAPAAAETRTQKKGKHQQHPRHSDRHR